MSSIKIENITKEFPGVKALDNISQHIESGILFTLLGPSGCGKTTLLRTIAGFYQQDSGHIHLAGEIIDNIPAHQRDTGMVFQNYAVFPHMTVYENIAFGLKMRKVPKDEMDKRIKKALEQVQLTGYEERTPEKLSGGQQQRVGLARAMVIEPKVLLMDEPLSNLDAKLRVEMRDEIRQMQKLMGITTVYVTHDQEEALAISDKIAVMSNGVIQQVGAPWEIYKNPVNTFVASFVGEMNFIPANIVGSKDGITEVSLASDITIRINTPSETPEKIQLAVRPEDMTIIGSAEESKDYNYFPGVIVKSLFIGSILRYEINCGDDFVLKVERHNPNKESILPEDTKVFIKVAVESLYVFDSVSGVRI
jgi:iron(III) transport system ATP-binding protein